MCAFRQLWVFEKLIKLERPSDLGLLWLAAAAIFDEKVHYICSCSKALKNQRQLQFEGMLTNSHDTCTGKTTAMVHYVHASV